MAKPAKILVIAHGHPDHAKGGGEIAAYNLHSAINASEDFESVFFARHNDPSLLHGGTAFSGTGRPGEVLFYATMPDWFQFSQPDKSRVWRDFRELLELTQPDVVHFHHYLHLGVELLREVKNYNPDLPLVLTLHEYFGICHNHGQMMTTEKNALCYESSPVACARCFPKKSPQEFFLRAQFIKSHFSLVDEFVSPSQFLIDRYVAWGLPREKMRLIENLMAPRHSKEDKAKEGKAKESGAMHGEKTANTNDAADSKVRFSFFGQVNGFKGIDVLLDAVQLLPNSIRKKLVVDINGSGLEHQPQELQRLLRDKFKLTGDTVNMRGPYNFTELPALMSSADWVVVPSKWWENSPMVILEAGRFGVPVICSNIGGMAEKVQHGQTGLHFQVGRADSLAQQMIWAVEHQDQRAHLAAAMYASFDPDSSLKQHLSLYQQLLGGSSSVHSNTGPALKAAG